MARTDDMRDAATAMGELRNAAMLSEPDRYVAATLAPPADRAALAAVAAFAAELARIPAIVSEPMLGDIRLQWWRDALASGREGQRSGHPVADALSEAAQRYRLDPAVLGEMIDARELDLSGGMPHDDAQLSAYLRATEGHPFRLALVIAGARGDLIDELAGPAGEAYGLARGLGRLAVQVHNGGVILPAERIRRAGADPNGLAGQPLAADVELALRCVTADLEAKARAALADVRAKWRDLDRASRIALLPLAMVEPYFRAQSGRRSVLELRDVSPFERVVRIGLARLTGRV